MADPKQVILGIFSDEAAADAAVEALKTWDDDTIDIKLDSIGVLVLDDKGQIKEHKLGRRSAEGRRDRTRAGRHRAADPPCGRHRRRGHRPFYHSGLGLSQADRDRITAELAGGKAAVGILAPVMDAPPISAKLGPLGATPEVHDVSEEALAGGRGRGGIGRGGRGVRPGRALRSRLTGDPAGGSSGTRSGAPAGSAMIGMSSATWSANGRASVLIRMISASTSGG